MVPFDTHSYALMGLHDFPYGKAMLKKPFLSLVVVAALSMTGCPSSDDGTSSGGSLASSGSVVYLADQNTDGVFELFLASSGAKLNGPLVSGGNVISFALTPDKSAVVYIADQQTDEVFELWRVSIATPGVSVKLNGTLILGGDVTAFTITPDGTSVVYRADQRIDQVFELFRVLFATPQASTLLNPAFLFGSGKSVTQFAVTPDSTKVVYIANQDANNVNELYQVAFGNPQFSTKLNAPLVTPGGNVTNFAVTPNSAAVVYLADLRLDQVFEIFLSPITAPGVGTPLNPPLNAPQSVASFAVTPDSGAVIYRADQNVPGTIELFRVAFASPQASTTLNGALIAGGNVTGFTIAPDGSSVVYSADQVTFGVIELFRVALTNPIGPAQKINPNFAAPQSVSAFAITPDSSAAVYLANQTVNTVTQLYRVPFSCLQANPAPSCPQAVPPPANLPPLNGTLATGGNVSSFSVSPDSTLVFYLADQTTFGVTELYAVNVGSPGSSSKLNGPLVAGGNVTAFTF